MKLYHVLIDTVSGCDCLSSVSVEKSFKTESAAYQYIEEELSDRANCSIDPDLISVEWSYLED